jgi:hypothetical protein
VLWGVGMAAQEGVLLSVLAPLMPAKRRAFGFGLYAAIFGSFWLAGSTLMGFLYGVNVLWLVIFSVVSQLAALPLLWRARGRAGR